MTSCSVRLKLVMRYRLKLPHFLFIIMYALVLHIFTNFFFETLDIDIHKIYSKADRKYGYAWNHFNTYYVVSGNTSKYKLF